MGILVNQNQIGGGGSSNSPHNIGDIFYTTRTDNSLNGAVECNGSQYNFSDFDSNLQSLFDEGNLPYLPINEFDSMVSEKGWCDKIGYKTPKMVKIYPAGNVTEQPFIYIELTDEQYSSFYDTMINCKRNEILPYRLYDINTAELLNGYYLKCTISDIGVFVVFNNEDEETSLRFHDHGTYYVTTDGSKTIPDPDKSQTDPTTYFKVPKLSAYIIQKENIPVIGNGMTLGITNGATTGGLAGFDATVPNLWANYGLGYDTNALGQPVKNTGSGSAITNSWWGVTTDGTKSGIIADLTNTATTERVMIQLFNGATDEAVAKCTEVLADVAGLKQATDGMIDYVVESQEPTEENNYSWYRLYKSGWVEQGGFCSGTAENNPVTLAIEMKDTEYTIVATNMQTTAVDAWGWIVVSRDSQTTTGFSLGGRQGTDSITPVRTNWQVSGMSAQK